MVPVIAALLAQASPVAPAQAIPVTSKNTPLVNHHLHLLGPHIAEVINRTPLQLKRVSFPPIAYKKHTLKNGLTVYSLRDMTTPDVSVSMWYDVGSYQDPHKLSGFAHLFEHLFSRKTVNIPYEGLNELVESAGGTRNAYTDTNATHYVETVPADRLEAMLWSHAERMSRLVIDDQIFERERKNVADEYRTFVLGSAEARLYNLILPEVLYDSAASRRPTIGHMEDLATANLNDAHAFYEAYYGPDSAALIVSGNFDETQLQTWVEKHFGSLPPRPRHIPLPVPNDVVPRPKGRLVTAYAPNVPAPTLLHAWRAPAAAHADVPAIEVLNSILSQGDNSRLKRSLLQKGLVTKVSSTLLLEEGASAYVVEAVTAEGQKMSNVEAIVDAEMTLLGDDPVGEAEVEEAKNELLGAALRARETFKGRATEFGNSLMRTRDPDAADRKLSAVQKVTAADVQRVARKYLSRKARVQIRYLNESMRPAGEPDQWQNPAPLRKGASLPPALRAPNKAASEAERQLPPGSTKGQAVSPPKIVQSKLRTGLNVVSAKTGEVPLATLALLINNGPSTDPSGKSGLANLAANIASKGTRTRSAAQIAAETEAIGASFSTSVTADSLTLSISAPVANIEKAGALLVDVVQNATFPAEELERAKKQAVASVNAAMREPFQLGIMLMEPILFSEAPYGKMKAGTPVSLATLTRDDVLRYHRQWWHPANASLIITGGIDNAPALALAQQLFGEWRGEGSPAAAPSSRAGKRLPPRTVVIDMPEAAQGAIFAVFQAVDPRDPAFHSLLVANAELGVGTSSRLFQVVRLKKSLAYQVGSRAFPRRDATIVAPAASPKNENIPAVIELFDEELRKLRKEEFDQSTLAKSKAKVKADMVRSTETSTGAAATLAEIIAQGLSPQVMVDYGRRLDEVTTRSVAAAAQALSPEHATLIVIGDASKFIDKLRTLRSNVEVIKIDNFNWESILRRR